MSDADLAARRVICASMAYYGLDTSLMPDSEYDGLCQFVAEFWDELEPDRQWALCSPEQIRTSGYHVKVSSQAQMATVSALGAQGLFKSKIYWTEEPQGNRNWVPCHAFRWANP